MHHSKDQSDGGECLVGHVTPPIMDRTSSSPFHTHIYNTNRQQKKPEAKNDPMATVGNGNAGTGNLDIYPAFCFKASPTHFAWVKMAAVDVHRLERRPGFEGQNIFFYLNYPIRFVCLAGVIVARTDVYRRTILTLDDSSGATIDIVVMKFDPDSVPKPQQRTQKGEEQEEEPSQQQQSQAQAGPETRTGSATEETHIATTAKTTLNITSLTPGMTIKVKGTLSTFRATIQLQLERVFAVPDTNAEVRFLDQRIRFLVEVLSMPWVLTGEEIERLRRDAEEEDERVEEEQERARKRQRKKVEREERDQRRIQKLWEQEERVREKEAVSCQDAGLRVMRELEGRKRGRGEQ